MTLKMTDTRHLRTCGVQSRVGRRVRRGLPVRQWRMGLARSLAARKGSSMFLRSKTARYKEGQIKAVSGECKNGFDKPLFVLFLPFPGRF